MLLGGAGEVGPAGGGDTAAPDHIFGAGAVEEAGWEQKQLGVRQTLIVTGPGVAAPGNVGKVLASVRAQSIEWELFDRAEAGPSPPKVGSMVSLALEVGRASIRPRWRT